MLGNPASCRGGMLAEGEGDLRLPRRPFGVGKNVCLVFAG